MGHTIKMDLRETGCLGVWTGFEWLRIESSGKLSWTK